MPTIRVACLAAVSALALLAPLATAAPIPADSCDDASEALATALTGSAVQGAEITALVERKAEGAGIYATSVSVLIDDEPVAEIAPPAAAGDPPASATIRLPNKRNLVVSFTWRQAPTGVFSCTGGEDAYRLVAHPSRTRLLRYLAAIHPSANEWNRVRIAGLSLVNGIDPNRPETFPAAADAVRRLAASDRSGSLAKRATPPPGLEAAHRGLVGTTTRRLRILRRLAHILDEAAQGRVPPSLDGDTSELQQPRRRWVREVAAEARFNNFALPGWARRVGGVGG